MKVVRDEFSGSWSVVPGDYGEVRRDSGGNPYLYFPIPVCRVPTGFGRTSDEARVIAERIAQLLNQTVMVNT